MCKPLIKVWRKDGFVLKVYDMQRQDRYGKWVVGYKFWDRGQLIFKGRDFHCSPLHAVDSPATAYGILGFLSLRPGDTDREYFDSYTPKQLAWCQSSRADELALKVDLVYGR